jgi:hypothetical protein
MRGDYERAITDDNDDPPFMRAAAPAMLGREAESLALYRDFERRGFEGLEAAQIRMVCAALEMDRERCLAGYRLFLGSGFRDPEGIYLMARNLSRVGAVEEALDCLVGVVDRGFWCIESAVPDPWLDPLRSDPRFTELLRRALEGRRRAASEYVRVGGERLLGPLPAR